MKNILKNIKDVLQGKASVGHLRSSRWPKVRAQHLTEHPTCAVCNSTTKIEVHHITPFHLDPSKELDTNNLITLCETKANGINCHLAFGHLGNYKYVNKTVITDAKHWNNKLKNRKITK